MKCPVVKGPGMKGPWSEGSWYEGSWRLAVIKVKGPDACRSHSPEFKRVLMRVGHIHQNSKVPVQ